jgi:hypothetical protein
MQVKLLRSLGLHHPAGNLAEGSTHDLDDETASGLIAEKLAEPVETADEEAAEHAAVAKAKKPDFFAKQKLPMKPLETAAPEAVKTDHPPKSDK